MEVSNACIMVLIQCRDREWHGDSQGNEAWARVAADKCLANGFAVLRVPTENWVDVKRKHPSWFDPVFKRSCDRQHVICSINYIYSLCPILEEVKFAMETTSANNVPTLEGRGYELLLPEGVVHISEDLFVVCEASSNIAATLTPRGLRLLYGYYPEPILWCGFNKADQHTGSKGIVGNAHSLLVLGGCLQRLKLYHIDQTYKALRSGFFALAQKDHICFGFLQHRSQCCDTSRGDAMPLSEDEYAPVPNIPTSIMHSKKADFLVDDALRSALQNTTAVRAQQTFYDIVCLRLRTYMWDDDQLLHANSGECEKHVQAVQEQKAKEKHARDACKITRLITSEDSSVHGNLEAALGTVEEAERQNQAQLEHPVVDWCLHNGWLSEETKKWKLLAMIERGLILAPSGQHLTCSKHSKQLWSFTLCWEHFTVTKTEHLEESSLDDLAEGIERSHRDEVDGVSTVLQRHYG